MEKKEEKQAKDFSTMTLCIAFGMAAGGVLFIPISKLLLPEAFQTSIEVNGQFGDFVGGLLNPLIAFLAFLWLRRGVIAQQKELEATRNALMQSESHQGNQVKIAAITALLTSSSDEYAKLRDYKKTLEPELNDLLIAHQEAQDQMEPNVTISLNEHTSSLLEEVNALDEALKKLEDQKHEYLYTLKEIARN